MGKPTERDIAARAYGALTFLFALPAAMSPIAGICAENFVLKSLTGRQEIQPTLLRLAGAGA